MATCSICGRRIGGFGEDKYKITEDYIACYKCAPLFRKIINAETTEQLEMSENELRIKIDSDNVSQEIVNAVENEIQRIKDSKHLMYQKEQFQMQKEEEIRKKRKAFMISTGYNFEGYKIEKYIDLAHGEIVLGTGFYSELSANISDLLGTSSKTFEGKLSQAKRAAQEQMIINAMTVNANALIGVDFDITTFSNNIIAVSANGTAVVIKKIEE